MKWWQTIGCNEPLSVRTVEYNMWKMLFTIVADPNDILTKIMTFLNTILEQHVPNNEAQWFSEGNTLHMCIYV